MESGQPNNIEQLPNLEDIKIKVPKLLIKDFKESSLPDILEEEKPIRVVFNGIFLDVNVSTTRNFNVEERRAHLYLTIQIDKKEGAENIAAISITIENKENILYLMYTDVSNTDRKIPGLGRALWKLSPKFAQQFADEWNVPITHTIMKVPKNNLSSEKWNELFLPLLEAYGYRKVDENEGENMWEKKYLPGNS